MKTVEQAIYDIIWKHLSDKMDVYDSRPMKEVAYPFADFEELYTTYTGAKNGATATVTANMNIWNTEYERMKVSAACNGLLLMAMHLNDAYGHKVNLRLGESSITVSQDRTVTPPIWRGMVILTFSI